MDSSASMKMNNIDKQYHDLLRDILANGVRKSDRTGTGTVSVFGRQIRHRMSDGFPLITTKKVHWKGIVEELLWFLRGETNIRPLVLKGVNIWVGDAYKAYCKRDLAAYNRLLEESLNDSTLPPMPAYQSISEKQFIELIKSDEKFASEYGELGPVYGAQWRNWSGIDQIANLINDLRNNPDSRRLLVNAWNVADVPSVILPPCHYGFQCYTRPLSLEERLEWVRKNDCNFDAGDEFGFGHNSEEFMHNVLTTDWQVPTLALSLQWTQRSVDTALGLPFNIASYGLLLYLLAKQVNMVPYELIGILGDTHIYVDQIEGVNEQLTRESFPLPSVQISNKIVSDISDYQFEDIKLVGYQSHSAIKIPLSN